MSISNEVTKATPVDLSRMESAYKMCQVLSKSDLVPKSYRQKPENVFLAYIAGQPFGWDVTMSMRSFHIIEGTPSLKPEIQLALVRQAGHSVTVEKSSVDLVVITGKRSDTGDIATASYSIEDAKRAGLIGKGNWKTYPEDMLFARAVSRLCRRLFQDVLLGCAYVPEELGATVSSDGEVLAVTSVAELNATISNLGTVDQVEETSEKIIARVENWTRPNLLPEMGVATSDQVHQIRVLKSQLELTDDAYRNASLVIKPNLEYVYFNAHNDFTLQYMVILAGVKVGDSDDVFCRKANLIAAYLDIMITRRMVEYKNYGYSPMYRPMFLLAKELRDKTLEEIRQILKTRSNELNETIDSIRRLRLTKTNKPDVYYLLARLTSWIGDEDPSIYLERNRKNPFEVEHILANKFERHTDEFSNEFEFNEKRNMFGDLLLLPKSFNASYGAEPFAVKVKHYFSQNPLAKSLNKLCYENNPQFLKRIKEFRLPFKPYEEDGFKSDAVVERQGLYAQMAEHIWSTALLDEI